MGHSKEETILLQPGNPFGLIETEKSTDPSSKLSRLISANQLLGVAPL